MLKGYDSPLSHTAVQCALAVAALAHSGLASLARQLASYLYVMACRAKDSIAKQIPAASRDPVELFWLFCNGNMYIGHRILLAAMPDPPVSN